ncbi:sugar transferase [Shewanella sp. TB4-MNA-CIBAN-0142]|uniref:sugar transferase n=1 Tax=Shewanella sp. TB4-MNA-CIBAN-0142 TaxID=3140464 RepID=UPI003325F2D3
MFKRLFDFSVSFFAIILLSPIILVVSILVRKNLGSPVIFTQIRPGVNGVPFKMFKFRTMMDAKNKEIESLSDSVRLTPFGCKLRALSLDELPGLLNVIKGDMSLVGPRPLLTRYYKFYTNREQVRHTVRPGVTGWAQINGRNTLNWNDRLEMDVWYVENKSFLLDLKIILLTIKKVIIREGVVVDAHSTMLNLDEERAQGQNNNDH